MDPRDLIVGTQTDLRDDAQVIEKLPGQKHEDSKVTEEQAPIVAIVSHRNLSNGISLLSSSEWDVNHRNEGIGKTSANAKTPRSPYFSHEESVHAFCVGINVSRTSVCGD
ncbi:hypothetical protein BDR03DRAFT_1002393 [Suillus americanus]|nr:hypothetical protein BDR03DRAFT_1002393 [Suillus americanus]